jgi:hypothetical protein
LSAPTMVCWTGRATLRLLCTPTASARRVKLGPAGLSRHVLDRDEAGGLSHVQARPVPGCVLGLVEPQGVLAGEGGGEGTLALDEGHGDFRGVGHGLLRELGDAQQDRVEVGVVETDLTELQEGGLRFDRGNADGLLRARQARSAARGQRRGGRWHPHGDAARRKGRPRLLLDAGRRHRSSQRRNPRLLLDAGRRHQPTSDGAQAQKTTPGPPWALYETGPQLGAGIRPAPPPLGCAGGDGAAPGFAAAARRRCSRSHGLTPHRPHRTRQHGAPAATSQRGLRRSRTSSARPATLGDTAGRAPCT